MLSGGPGTWPPHTQSSWPRPTGRARRAGAGAAHDAGRAGPQVLSTFYGAPPPRSPLSVLDANRLVVGGPRACASPRRAPAPPQQRSAAVQAGPGGLRGLRPAQPPRAVAGRAAPPAGAEALPAGERAQGGAIGGGDQCVAGSVAMGRGQEHPPAHAAQREGDREADGGAARTSLGPSACAARGGAATSAAAADPGAPRRQAPVPWPLSGGGAAAAAAGSGATRLAGPDPGQGRSPPGGEAPDAAARGSVTPAPTDAAGAAPRRGSAGARPDPALERGAGARQCAGLLTAQLTAIAAAAAAAATAAVRGRPRSAGSTRAAPRPATGGCDGASALGGAAGAGGGRAAGYDPRAYTSCGDEADAGAGASARARSAAAADADAAGAGREAGAWAGAQQGAAPAAWALPPGWVPAMLLPPLGLWGLGSGPWPEPYAGCPQTGVPQLQAQAGPAAGAAQPPRCAGGGLAAGASAAADSLARGGAEQARAPSWADRPCRGRAALVPAVRSMQSHPARAVCLRLRLEPPAPDRCSAGTGVHASHSDPWLLPAGESCIARCRPQLRGTPRRPRANRPLRMRMRAASAPRRTGMQRRTGPPCRRAQETGPRMRAARRLPRPPRPCAKRRGRWSRSVRGRRRRRRRRRAGHRLRVRSCLLGAQVLRLTGRSLLHSLGGQACHASVCARTMRIGELQDASASVCPPAMPSTRTLELPACNTAA